MSDCENDELAKGVGATEGTKQPVENYDRKAGTYQNPINTGDAGGAVKKTKGPADKNPFGSTR